MRQPRAHRSRERGPDLRPRRRRLGNERQRDFEARLRLLTNELYETVGELDHRPLRPVVRELVFTLEDLNAHVVECLALLGP